MMRNCAVCGELYHDWTMRRNLRDVVPDDGIMTETEWICGGCDR